MAKPKWDGKIPFDENGNQLHYASPWAENVTYLDNAVFDDELTLLGTSRGQSAAYFRLQSARSGRHYTMFVTDVADILQRGTVANGVIAGMWTFCKRGANFGIRLIEED